MFRTLAYATLFSTALIGSHAYGADNAVAELGRIGAVEI